MPRLPQLHADLNACESPHVVLLGAGASLAAFPHGDRNGRKLPLMHNLVEVVGLQDLVPMDLQTVAEENFEAFYSEIAQAPEHAALRKQIERRIRDYFASLELPDETTLYDRLLLSLRSKDVVATFNWDPFLPLAFKRNRHLRKLPRMVFLHGNVAVGACKTDRSASFVGDPCQFCGKPLEPTKLLYPIGKKDYTSDPFISGEWEVLSSYLEDAYLFTIFGYSAPVSDVEAKELMQSVWASNPSRELAQIEIVDIKNEGELEQTWQPFFTRDHYFIADSVEHTWLFHHPRRSCDAFAAATLMLDPWAERPIPCHLELRRLQEWIEPLVREEVQMYEHRQPLQPTRK